MRRPLGIPIVIVIPLGINSRKERKEVRLRRNRY